MVDAYDVTASQRENFVDRIVEFVVHDTAFQADEAGVTQDTRDSEALWGLAWRAQAAAWLLRHRQDPPGSSVVTSLMMVSCSVGDGVRQEGGSKTRPYQRVMMYKGGTRTAPAMCAYY